MYRRLTIIPLIHDYTIIKNLPAEFRKVLSLLKQSQVIYCIVTPVYEEILSIDYETR